MVHERNPFREPNYLIYTSMLMTVMLAKAR
jgi:hypothetical protein